MKANKVRATLGTFLGLALLFCSGASFAALTATEIQKLVGSEVLPTDLFGDEVTLEGDTILVDRGQEGLTFSVGVQVVEGEVVEE